MADWLKWTVSALVSALTTTALGAWYMSATLTGINDHLQRLDSGQQTIMQEHQSISDQMYSTQQQLLIVVTMLHDQNPDKVPLPSTGTHDGFETQK
jgi:hypothetical protein